MKIFLYFLFFSCGNLTTMYASLYAWLHGERLRDLHYKTRKVICEELNKKCDNGNNFKLLANLVGIRFRGRNFTSHADYNQTEQILSLWCARQNVSVAELQNVLLQMDRNDAVNILDKHYRSGIVLNTLINFSPVRVSFWLLKAFGFCLAKLNI